MADRARSVVGTLAVPAGIVLCWQGVMSAGLIDYDYLPSPGDVLAAFIVLGRDGELARDIAHTLGVAALATGVAMILGAAIGFAMGLVLAVRRYGLAGVDVLRTIPAVALVPVAVLTFGPLTSTEVMLAVYAATWPIVLHTAAGAASVPARQYDVGRMLHFSTAATVRKIVVPNVIPAWLVGARLSATIALLVAVVAEMVMYPRGLGGGLIESMHALAPARMWAYALTCGILGAAVGAGLRALLRVVAPGDPAVSGREHPAPARHEATLRGLLPIAAVLILWQVLAEDDSLSFPPPDAWLAAAVRLARDGLLLPAIGHTLGTYAAGLMLAVLAGAAMGAAIGRSATLNRLLTPTLDFVAAIPGAALVPVAVLMFGTTAVSGILVTALIVSWPVLLNTTAAARSIPVVREEMSRMLGLSRVQRWVKVLGPSLAPGAVLGVSVASSLAVIIALLVDIFGAGAGIGRLLVLSQQQFDAAAVWALLTIVGMFGYSMNLALSRLRTTVTAPVAALRVS